MNPLGYAVSHIGAVEAIRRRERPNAALVPIENVDPYRDAYLWFGDTTERAADTGDIELPEVVFAPEDRLREIFSRLLAYGGDLFPVTSLVRILPYSLTPCLIDVSPASSLRLDLAAIRAAFGEAVEVSSPGQVGLPSTLSVHRQIRSSFLWVAAQTRNRWGLDASVALSRWRRVQSLARFSSPTRAPLWEHRLLVATLLAGHYDVLDKHPPCTDMVAAIVQRHWDEGVELAARILGVMVPSMDALSEGPYERRISTATAMINAGADSVGDPIKKAIAVATVLTAITRGSMEHFHVAVRYSDRFPGACIWYGLLSGLGEDSIVRPAIPECRLVRMVRTGSNTWRPVEADIGLEELEVLANSSITKVRSLSALGSIEVEVLPTVSVPVRLQDGEGQSERARFEPEQQQQLPLDVDGRLSQPDATAGRLEEVRAILEQAITAIDGIRGQQGLASGENWSKRNRKPKSRGAR